MINRIFNTLFLFQTIYSLLFNSEWYHILFIGLLFCYEIYLNYFYQEDNKKELYNFGRHMSFIVLCQLTMRQLFNLLFNILFFMGIYPTIFILQIISVAYICVPNSEVILQNNYLSNLSNNINYYSEIGLNKCSTGLVYLYTNYSEYVIRFGNNLLEVNNVLSDNYYSKLVYQKITKYRDLSQSIIINDLVTPYIMKSMLPPPTNRYKDLETLKSRPMTSQVNYNDIDDDLDEDIETMTVNPVVETSSVQDASSSSVDDAIDASVQAASSVSVEDSKSVPDAKTLYRRKMAQKRNQRTGAMPVPSMGKQKPSPEMFNNLMGGLMNKNPEELQGMLAALSGALPKQK